MIGCNGGIIGGGPGSIRSSCFGGSDLAVVFSVDPPVDVQGVATGEAAAAADDDDENVGEGLVVPVVLVEFSIRISYRPG